MLLIGSLPIVGEAGEPAPKNAPRNQCWSDADLKGRAADKRVLKDTPLAMVDPPTGELLPFNTVTAGAIRRVELPPGVKKVALTFDLCEQPYEVAGYDAEIVNYLREQNIHATFFAGGKWLLSHQVQGPQLIADPLFEMGTHTWAHRNLRLLAGEALNNEIKWAQLALEGQAGNLTERQCTRRDGKPVSTTRRDGMSLFRFPFGACNKASLEAVAHLGLVPIQWDVSSGDPSGRVSAPAMAADVLRRVRPGSIVLFHANGRGWHTAQALKGIIPGLRRMGYEFVTVGELLRTPGAKAERQPFCYDSRPGDTDHYDALARRLESAYARFNERFTVPPAVPRPVPAQRSAAEVELHP